MDKRILAIGLVVILLLVGTMYSRGDITLPGNEIKTQGSYRYIESDNSRLVVGNFPDGGQISVAGVHLFMEYQTLDMAIDSGQSIEADYNGPLIDFQVVRLSDHVVIVSGSDPCNDVNDIPIRPVGSAGDYELRVSTSATESWTPLSMTLKMHFVGSGSNSGGVMSFLDKRYVEAGTHRLLVTGWPDWDVAQAYQSFNLLFFIQTNDQSVSGGQAVNGEVINFQITDSYGRTFGPTTRVSHDMMSGPTPFNYDIEQGFQYTMTLHCWALVNVDNLDMTLTMYVN
jgi:hypothetical protein